MKKLLIISFSLFLILVFNQADAQPFTAQNPGLPLASSTHTVWGDYDNDGDLDLLYSGVQTGTGTSLTYLYKNNNGSFVNSGVSLQTIATGVPNVLDFGDVNNDGFLDILVCGNGKSGLYLNNQSGGFSSYAVSIDAYTDTYGGFYDLNSDGKIDILIGAFVWINNGSMSFTRKSSGIPYYQFNNLDVADYDLDGFLDVALIGNSTLEIYKNDGTGTFSAIGASIPGFTHFHYGSGMYIIPGVKWGDFDQDGDPDLLSSGFNTTTNQMETILFENQGFGTFAFKESYLPYIGNSNIWVDVNFDGALDVVSAGLNYNLTDDLIKISINDGGGKFSDSGLDFSTLQPALPSLSVVDYQQDGDPDILLTGSSLSRLFKNENTIKNTKPNAPTIFKMEEMGTQTHLYWESGSDTETKPAALTYNVRIGTSSNLNLIRTADSNPSTGFVRTVKPGNAGGVKELYLSDLQPGETYLASVQTIDNGYRGSDWYPDQTITLIPSKPVLTDPTELTENSFVINWTASYGANYYYVMVSENASFTLPLSGYNPASWTENNIRVNGLTKYKKYYVKVAAINTGGQSAYSDVKEIMATDGLTARYDFTGDNKDSGPFETNLSQSGNAVLTADRFGNANSAVYLEGSTYLMADASHLPTKERTISLWVKMDDSLNHRSILGYGGNNSPTSSFNILYTYNNGKYGWMTTAYSSHTLFSPREDVAVGKWVHLVAENSPDGSRIYINNQLVATNTDFNTDTYVNGKKLLIGNYIYYDGLTALGSPFIGAIDDIRIYDRALTAIERESLFKANGFNPTPDVTGLTISKVTGGTISASWNSIAGNPVFEVQVATDATFINTVSGYGSYLTSQNSVKITGLTANTDYFIRVRSKGYNIAGTFANAPTVKTTNGIVAQFDFSGNGKDSGPFGKDLTPVGASLVPDRFGNPNSAYRFNENRTSYLIGDASELPTETRTVAMWMKSEDVAGYSFMLTYGGNNNFQFVWYPGNPGRFDVKDSQSYWLTSQATEQTNGSWIHVAFTTSPNGSKLFVNGKAKTTNAAYYKNTGVAGKKLMVGASLNSDGTAWEGNGFVGTIDDIKIYDVELTEAELLALAETGGFNPTPDITGQLITKITGSTFSAQWDKPASVENFEYQIATDVNFNSLVPGYESTKITTNSVKVAGLNPNQDYFFRVRTIAYERQGNFNSYSHIHTTDGLMAQYDFSGNTIDSGPYAKDLTPVGATLVPDRFGNPNSAYRFNENRTSYLIGDASELPTGTRTVAMWIKTEDVASYSFMLTYGGYSGTASNFQFAWYPGNQGRFDVKDSQNYWLSSQATQQTNGSWIHVAFTTGQNGSKIFINGKSKANNGTFYKNTGVAGKKIMVGASLNSDGTAWEGNGFVGTIDDIKIYDVELTEDEIYALTQSSGYNPTPDITGQLITKITGSTFSAQWDKPVSVENFEYQVATDVNFNSLVPGYESSKITTNSVKVVGLSPNLDYYFRVRSLGYEQQGNFNSLSHVHTTDGLVAKFDFSGDAADSGPFLKNLTSMGATLTTDRFGKANSAYYLDGNTHLIGDGSELPSRERAISMWVKLDITTGYNYLFSYGGGNSNQTFNLRYINNQWQIVDYYESWYLTAPQPDSPKDSWVHLVAMTGPTGSKFFVNGAQKGSNASFLSTTQPVGNKLIIGARSRLDGTDIDGYRMTGSVDDIRIYDRELSLTEIDALYKEGNYEPKPGNISNLAYSGVTGTAFHVTWEPALNATRYRVELSDRQDFSTLISTQDILETKADFTGLTPSSTYYIRVTPYNLYGGSQTSDITVTTTSGLVSQYDFSGNAQDSGPVGNNLDIGGATLTNDRFGHPNSAYFFDGSDYLKGSASSLPSGERTVSIWVNPTILSNQPHFLSYGGGSCGTSFFMAYDYKYQNQGWSLSGHCDANTLTWLPPDSPAGNWTHFVIRTGPSGTDMYINGVRVNQNTGFISNTNTNGKDFFVGALVNNSGTGAMGGYTKGVIDDIRIYDVALTETQISDLFHEGNWTSVPEIPTIQAATDVYDQSFIANWNQVDNVNGYYLDVSKDQNFLSFISGYQGLDVQAPGVSVTGLTELTTYYYRVRAYNLAGASGYSNSVSVTTMQSPLMAPKALEAASVQNKGFIAKWEPQTAPYQYQIEVSTDVTFANLISGYNPKTIDNINSVSSLVVAGLQPVTTYFYRLKGIRGSEVSDYSNVVEVTTQATPVVPDRPVVLDATAIDLHQFTANWRESNGALSYNVYVATDSLFTSQLTNWDPKNVTETSVVVNALNAGRKYWYRVKAVNEVGPSAYSDSIKVETLFSAPVSQPSSLPTNGGFTANWLPVTNAAYYLLDVSKNADFTEPVSGYENLRVNITNSEVTGITTSGDYFYRVRAVSAFGVTSPNSESVTVSVTFNDIVAPIATSATNVNQNSFVANWESVPGAGQYEVQVSTDGFISWITKTSVTNFVVVSGLNAFTDYEYKVRAKIAGVWSDFSNTIQVTTDGSLGAPSLTVNSIKTTSFDLSWIEVNLAIGYTIVVAKNIEFTDLFDSLYTTSTTMTVTGLTEDKTYYVRGYSVRDKYCSVPSEVKTVKTLSGLPDAPVATEATEITQNSYQANWNPVANAQSYEVHQSTNGFVTWVKQNVSVNKATFSPLSPATTYKYRVNVTDINGKTSGYSNEITVTTKSAVPAKPVLNDPAEVSQTGFTLTWTSDPPSIEYYVDVATQEDFAPSSILSAYKNRKVTGTTLAVSDLGQGLTYWARVRGYDGKVYGDYSNVVSKTTLSQTLSTPVLNAPTSTNPTSFTISWADITGETGYQINVSLNASFSPNLIGYDKKDVLTNSVTVNNLQPGTLYYVQVRAVNTTTVTFSSYSATAQVTTTIAVPELLDPDQIQTTSFRAKWNPVTNVGSYRLDVSKDNTFTQIVSGYNDKVIPSSSTNLVVSTLTKKTVYYYRLRAVKGTFTTANSAVKTVTTEDEAVIPATSLTAKDTTSTGFIAQWENPGIGYTVALDVATDNLFASKVEGYNEKSVTGVTEAEVSGLNPFTTYYYRIKVTDGATSYAYSNTISVKTRVAKVLVNEAGKVDENSFEISWTPVNGATDYAITVSKNSLLFPLISGYPKTTKSSPFTVSGLDEKTQYYFAVAGYNSDGTGDISTIKNVTTEAAATLATPVLNQPTDRTQAGFTISWSEVPGATGFRYDLALDIAFSQTLTGYVNEPTTATSLNVTNRLANTIYYFRVKAVTETKESGYAVSSGIKTMPELPGIPTVSVPTNESPTSFIANWQTVIGADSYLLDVSSDENFAAGKWILQNDTLTATQKLVSELTPSTDYYYRVRARNEAGASGYSTAQKAATTSGKPGQPVLSASTSISSTGFTINWTAPIDAESYKLDVGTDNPITVFVGDYNNKTVTGTSETLTGLTSGMTFYYQVRAVNGYGTSPGSQVGTTLLIPAAPTANSPTNETATSFTANWQAATGASGYFLDVSESNLFTTFVSGNENRPVSGTSVSVSGLTTNNTYFYRVRATNASGTSVNSNVVSLTLLPLAPAFSNLAINPTTAVLGTSDVEIKITIANSPVSVFLFYGSPTASVLTQTTMTLSGGQYGATISKNSYSKEGLVFRISAENERGKSWFPAENQLTSIPVNIPVENIISEVIPTSSFPAGVEKETWNTISLPFTGSVNLTTILGTQEFSGGEPVNWAAYTFTGIFTSVNQISGGQGYFLYHKSGDGANLIKNAVTAAGTIVTYDQNAFGNALLATGWNLVAWPYTYGAQVTVKDGTKISSVWQMKAGSWEKNSTVKPFGGYAIYNKTGSGNLKVSDVLSWTTQSLSKTTGSDLAQYDADWLVKLGVSSETSSDNWNFIGVSNQASAGFDLLDEKNPVSPEAGLDLFVTEEEAGQSVALAASIKNAGKGLKVWNLTVTSSLPGKQKKLSWEHLNVPDDINLLLVDLTAKRTVDLQKSKTGVLALSSALESNLQIFAGSSAEIESALQELKSNLTVSFVLFPNYPNPFNPSTMISFEMGRDEVLDLAIYNSIGQKIKTVYSGVALAGKQQIEWNGKDDAGNPVSSGVYFCTMKAGTFIKTNKMLLTR